MKILVFRGLEGKSLCSHLLMSPMFNQLNPVQLSFSFNIIQTKFRPTFDFKVQHRLTTKPQSAKTDKNTHFLFLTAN